MPAATGSRNQAGQLRVSDLCCDTGFNVVRNFSNENFFILYGN